MNDLDSHDRLIIEAILQGKTIFTSNPYKVRSYPDAFQFLADGMGDYLKVKEGQEDENKRAN